jgi:5-methylthioadenosine/S-adenosylhomocysteine deaminase
MDAPAITIWICFREMDTTAKIHKVTSLNPIIMNAEKQFAKWPPLAEQKVLGMDKLIGSVETGKKADIIMVDMNQPQPHSHFITAILKLVYATRGAGR